MRFNVSASLVDTPFHILLIAFKQRCLVRLILFRIFEFQSITKDTRSPGHDLAYRYDLVWKRSRLLKANSAGIYRKGVPYKENFRLD